MDRPNESKNWGRNGSWGTILMNPGREMKSLFAFCSSDERIFISDEQCGALIWYINWKQKIWDKCPHRLDKNIVFVTFTQIYLPLFIRHVVRFVQFQGIRLIVWQGLTTSKTMAKCDIATTWMGKGPRGNDKWFFVAVFGTPLSTWRSIQLSNIREVLYRTYWDRKNRPGDPHCTTQDQFTNFRAHDSILKVLEVHK